MRDRIRPTKEHDDLLNRLSKQDGVFATRQKAMMFGAAIGFVLDRAESPEAFEGYGEGIPLSVFERAGDDAFIDALAVSQQNDLSILSPANGDRRLEIFEHYARKGLDRLEKACYRGGQDPLQGILEILDDFDDAAVGTEANQGLGRSLEQLAKLI